MLVIGEGTAHVEPRRPLCPDEHVMAWTGVGFPRHPTTLVQLCVNCWWVSQVIDRGE